jgi:hypothetical protein
MAVTSISNQPQTQKVCKFKIKNPNNKKSTSHHVVNPNTQHTPSPKKLKFKIKQRLPSKNQFQLFVELCNKHSLPYFQFYDQDLWCGPVTKVLQEDFDHVLEIFESAQDSLKTIILNGFDFVIIKPIHKLDDSNIQYPTSHFDACRMTQSPIIPYNSDMEVSDYDSDSESDSENQEEPIVVEEEFIAEEWKYNNTIYLLDTSTNYVYSPSTLEFVGKKTSEFSIDYDAKEY